MLAVLPVLVAAFVAADTTATPLQPDLLYNAVNRPIVITYASESPNTRLSLALLTADGGLVASAFQVEPGKFDLGSLMPEVWTIARACYLQPMDGGRPVGQALVVQPVRSRMVPLTEPAQRPGGSTYTRIFDWKDEYQPPASPPPARTEPDEAEAEAEGEAEAVPAPPRVGRLLSGLRIYPEQDVVLSTGLGDIVVGMRPDQAPNTVWNFLRLVEGGFYEGVVFHRVVPLTRSGDPFVIQGGDPTGTGEGGPGYWLPIEPSELPHDFGVISMARADDPDSAGSQFFFGLSRAGTARLDGQYCAFGWTIEGDDTIRAIAAGELADITTGRPVNPTVINSTSLRPAGPHPIGRGRDEPAPGDATETPLPPERIPR